MIEPIYRCPVCGLPLSEEEKRAVCPKGHSFDRARQGHFNLLLANQSHGLEQGDKKELVEARARFLEGGYYEPLRAAILKLIAPYASEGRSFCDLACGEGYYTARVAERFPSLCCYAVDISKSAAASTARRGKSLGLKNLHVAIGNMAYLPFRDHSFDVLLNCFAPIYENEFLRVAKKGALYLRVLPGPNHLLGLKKALYEDVRMNAPKEEELPGFERIETRFVDAELHLEGQAILDLFEMTPYSYKTGKDAVENLRRLKSLDTPISFVFSLYRKQ